MRKFNFQIGDVVNNLKILKITTTPRIGLRYRVKFINCGCETIKSGSEINACGASGICKDCRYGPMTRKPTSIKRLKKLNPFTTMKLR